MKRTYPHRRRAIAAAPKAHPAKMMQQPEPRRTTSQRNDGRAARVPRYLCGRPTGSSSRLHEHFLRQCRVRRPAALPFSVSACYGRPRQRLRRVSSSAAAPRLRIAASSVYRPPHPQRGRDFRGPRRRKCPEFRRTTASLARRRRHGGRKDGTRGAAEARRARERGAKEATVQLRLLLQ